MRGHILIYLKQNEFVKRKELLPYLKSLGVRRNDRMMRQEINQMIVDDGLCIMSNEKGYRLIQNESELKTAVDYLKQKSRAIDNRINHIVTSFTSKKQLTLF